MINDSLNTVNKLQTALLLAEVFVSGLPKNTPFQKFEQRWSWENYKPAQEFLSPYSHSFSFFWSLQISRMGTGERMGWYRGTSKRDPELPLWSSSSTWSIKYGEILQQSPDHVQHCDLLSSRLFRASRCSWIARHRWPGLEMKPSPNLNHAEYELQAITIAFLCLLKGCVHFGPS